MAICLLVRWWYYYCYYLDDGGDGGVVVVVVVVVFQSFAICVNGECGIHSFVIRFLFRVDDINFKFIHDLHRVGGESSRCRACGFVIFLNFFVCWPHEGSIKINSKSRAIIGSGGGGVVMRFRKWHFFRFFAFCLVGSHNGDDCLCSFAISTYFSSLEVHLSRCHCVHLFGLWFSFGFAVSCHCKWKRGNARVRDLERRPIWSHQVNGISSGCELCSNSIVHRTQCSSTFRGS